MTNSSAVNGSRIGSDKRTRYSWFDYNRRKKRKGAFWESRYHATMVDSGEYLSACLKYVELNMVRCGVVGHPREWDWSGYGELMGRRKRNRLLDMDKLLWLVRASTLDEFRAHFNATLDEALVNDELKRQEKWATALAVGSQGFVEAIERRIRNRQQMERQTESGVWVLREEYGSLLDGQNASMRQFQL